MSGTRSDGGWPSPAPKSQGGSSQSLPGLNRSDPVRESASNSARLWSMMWPSYDFAWNADRRDETGYPDARATFAITRVLYVLLQRIETFVYIALVVTVPFGIGTGIAAGNMSGPFIMLPVFCIPLWLALTFGYALVLLVNLVVRGVIEVQRAVVDAADDLASIRKRS